MHVCGLARGVRTEVLVIRSRRRPIRSARSRGDPSAAAVHAAPLLIQRLGIEIPPRKRRGSRMRLLVMLEIAVVGIVAGNRADAFPHGFRRTPHLAEATHWRCSLRPVLRSGRSAESADTA